MVDACTGDGPNVGANDGARLLPLSDTPYRDYRPSVQLAMTLFASQRAYAGAGLWDQPAIWLGLQPALQQASAPASFVADDGGFAVLRRGKAAAAMRYPRFRFRPSHADALHIDLSLNGEALLKDAGSYGYNTDAAWLDYFAGTAGHNTIQFDARDQMPRIGRFLFGDWLRTRWMEPLAEDDEQARFGAGYRDSSGAVHKRRMTLTERSLRVEDEISGFTHDAVLRWRLRPGRWKLHWNDGTAAITDEKGVLALTIRSGMPASRCEMVQGWESLHYLEKTPTPVVEFATTQPGTVITEVVWRQ
jgi:hypothetical protein